MYLFFSSIITHARSDSTCVILFGYVSRVVSAILKPIPQDLEAQKKSSGSTSPTTLERSITAQTSLGSSRAGGRGGAGNFYDASATDAVAAAQQEEKEAELEELTRVVTASIQRPNLSGRLSGRGGAGNYSDNAARSAQQRMDPEQQRKMIEDLNARVLQDVEAGLAMPRPAYHAKFELKHERLVSAEP